MNEPVKKNATSADSAADWVLRCDRGLSASEQDDFSAWLAADPRHREELARHRGHWRRLDRLAEWRPEHGAVPNPDLLAPPSRRRVAPWTWAGVAVAAAAAVVAILLVSPVRPDAGADTEPTAPGPSQRLLADGSMVELNRDAEIAVAFGAGERRVELLRGEAMFSVQRDVQRPFVVVARGVAVRALGTAFNVRVDAGVVEVLVTEGTVQVEPPPSASPASALSAATSAPPLLQARQRAVIDLAPARLAPQIATLTAGEVERVLAWQHRQLDFTAAPLAQIVAEFNRRNVVQLVVVDPGLAAERISATFRSDNIAGFVRLLEVGFGAQAEQRGESEIVLRRDGRR